MPYYQRKKQSDMLIFKALYLRPHCTAPEVWACDSVYTSLFTILQNLAHIPILPRNSFSFTLNWSFLYSGFTHSPIKQLTYTMFSGLRNSYLGWIIGKVRRCINNKWLLESHLQTHMYTHKQNTSLFIKCLQTIKWVDFWTFSENS
jgi:hypothetical protein